MEALLDIQDKVDKDKNKIFISWDYKDLIDDRFLIYIALLQLQGKKFDLDYDFYANIDYEFNPRYHEIMPLDKKIEYSTYILVLMEMINSNKHIVNIDFPENRDFEIYVIDKDITDGLLELLKNLKFPQCTIHGVIRAIESRAYYSDDSDEDEVALREDMFIPKRTSDELVHSVMNYIGLGRPIKSARNV